MIPLHPGVLVLPFLACVIAAAIGLRGRSLTHEGSAALVYGLVATAFLWPALTIPDGVPSPSAHLYAHAPWQTLDDAPDPSAGNAALPDVTYQIQPWLLLLKSQLRAGELPLWNPYSFLGQPFWANGQSAPLFPLHLLFAALPTMWGFLLLPWLRILIGALGTRRLALTLGVGPVGALLAGVVFPLSGMVTGYLLFPMANALVMVPWVLWATERLVSGAGSWRTLAVCVSLLALGGHPGTLSHCLLLSVVYLAVRVSWTRGTWKRLAACLAGWATGGALAMVHLLPVALYLPDTARWGDPDGPGPGPGPPWLNVLAMIARLLQPWVYGRAENGTWHGLFYEPGSRVFVGLLTLVLALVALQQVWSSRRGWFGTNGADRRLPAVAAMLAFSALVAYRTPFLLDAVESLPVVGRALHHRLMFGVDLSLALLAGFGLDRAAGRRPYVRRWLGRSAALVTFGLGLVAFLTRREGDFWINTLESHGPWLVWLVLVTLCLLLLPRWMVPGKGRGKKRGNVLLFLPALLVAAELTVAHAPSAPGLSVRHLYPPTGATEFLADRQGNVAGVGQTLRPGTSMVYGLRDLRGDDPARPRRFDGMYEHLGSIQTPFFHPVQHWSHPWLDAAGIRWVMTPPRVGPKDPTWRLAYDGDDARVFERPEARPGAWLTTRDAELTVQRPANFRVRVAGLDGADGRVVVSQAWAPGWTARVGDRTLATVAHEEFLLAVDLADSESATSVDFIYRPPGFETGAWISLAALAVLLWPFVAALFREETSETRRSRKLSQGTERIQSEASRGESSPSAV